MLALEMGTPNALSAEVIVAKFLARVDSLKLFNSGAAAIASCFMAFPHISSVGCRIHSHFIRTAVVKVELMSH